MIDEIRNTPSSPFNLSDFQSFPMYEERAADWVPTEPQGGSGTSSSVQYFSVTLSGVPSEAGDLSGSGSFSQGSTVTVSATARDGYEFIRWIESGVEVSTRATFTFNIYSDRHLEAVFISTNSGSASETVENDLEQ